MSEARALAKQPTSVHIDLLREREFASANLSEEFAEWWYGGREQLQQRRKLEKLFFDDPDLEDKENPALLSHKELYEYTLAKNVKFFSKLRANLSQGEAASTEGIQLMYYIRNIMSGPIGLGLFRYNLPCRLHYAMFVPALLRMGSDEQHRQWLQRAVQMEGIVGAYAQTELAHGTNLKGLETRADYDEQRQQFVINTPSLNAYKWWPGGLGQTANMAIIMAQTYVRGKHCGLHPFLVRIRCEKTHAPLEGIDVGEIGPTMGGQAVNNGFLGFKNVRIPRTQMLMRNAQVLPDGSFVRSKSSVLNYGTMVYVRVMIVRDASFGLIQAATIATRYSAVRRQGMLAADQPETPILDYVTQQAKVFPQIAKGIFYRIAADHVWTMYQQVIEQIDAGSLTNLPEMHALSCCLKAVCTQESSDGVEVLRKSCGGHGFLVSANFSQIYGYMTAACTYEGENTVLLLQTARFLIKSFVDGLKRKVLPSSVTYLRNQARLTWSSKDMLQSIVRALEITAMEKTRVAFEYQRVKRKQTDSELLGNNLAGLKLTQAAVMHGRAFLARIACAQVQSQRQKINSKSVTAVLRQLLEIFVIDLFISSLADVLQFNAISARQVAEVEQRFEQIMAELRQNAVALVDGFDLHDRVLNSTLGCWDGRVYERLMEDARKSSLNQSAINAAFDTHLKPFLSAGGGKL